MLKNQCISLLKYQHSHVFPFKKKKFMGILKNTYLHAMMAPVSVRLMLFFPAISSQNAMHATSCHLTRPPAILHRWTRVLSPPFPMEILPLIHGAAVTAGLLWKMLRAKGLLLKKKQNKQKQNIFPLHLGFGNPNDPLKIQSVMHCSLNEPLRLNTSYSLSHSLGLCILPNSFLLGSRGFDNNAD